MTGGDADKERRKDGAASQRPGPAAEREAKLAQALRANLRRRKAERAPARPDDAGPDESA